MKFGLQYISHGKYETGGFLHEKCLAEALAGKLENCSDCFNQTRFRKSFRGAFGWINLAFKAFIHTKRNGNVISVARLAWPVWLKVLTGKGKMLLVLHNYDPADQKPRLYYLLLDQFLKLAKRNPNRIAVITVAKYWQHHIEDNFGFTPFLFPNLFDPAPYAFYAGVAKKNHKLIHLGQFSEKIDRKAYLLLIHELNIRGYACYFSSNEPEFNSHFPISFFKTREAYLKQMAISGCTVIINQIKEGWNRVAHESLLVGTQVIAVADGGPKELAETLGAYAVNNIQEVMNILENNPLKNIDHKLLEPFDLQNASTYLKPITKFIRNES